jgi:hypothetical protein
MGNDADVKSIDALIAALYEVISGRASDKRDWDRMRTLYAPGARVVPIEKNERGDIAPSLFDIDGFIRSRTAMLALQDFFEWETGRETKRVGRMAHVLSHYEAARTPGGTPIRRGANSIQLWNDGSRWWILSIVWDAVSAAEL